MKKILLLAFMLLSISVNSQTQDSELIQPSEGKCIVYITRQSSAGPLINFSVFDGEKFLGKLKANRFIAYECDPGEHIFIAKSENTDYIEANLEEGRVYAINAEARVGIVKARVQLSPLDKSEKKYDKKKAKFIKFVTKKKGELLLTEEGDDKDTQEEDIEETPSKTLKKFYEKKAKGKKVTLITADMYIEPNIPITESN